MIGFLGCFASLNSGYKVTLCSFCRDLNVCFCEDSFEVDNLQRFEFVGIHEGDRD